MLSVLATLPYDRGGLDGSVIYIDTEAAFSATRLVVLCQVSILSHIINKGSRDNSDPSLRVKGSR